MLIMNKFYPLVILSVLSLGFGSCKKDSGSTNPNNFSTAIVGSWKPVSLGEQDFEGGTLTTAQTNTSFDALDFVRFNADNSGVFSESAGTGLPATSKNFNYLITGSTISMSNESIFTAMGDSKITTLTATTLVIHYEHSETTDGVTYKIIEDTTFKK